MYLHCRRRRARSSLTGRSRKTLGDGVANGHDGAGDVSGYNCIVQRQDLVRLKRLVVQACTREAVTCQFQGHLKRTAAAIYP